MSGGGCGSSTLDFERLRARYRPDRIVALFVGESPPASGTFFYAANSNLYRHTEQAFREVFGYRISSDFLASFAALGCFLDDLCLKPVNQLDNHERREARIAGEVPLAARIRSYAPRVVIGIGCTLERHFQRAHRLADPGVDVPLHVVPFPNWPEQRLEYLDGLASLLRRLNDSDVFPQ